MMVCINLILDVMVIFLSLQIVFNVASVPVAMAIMHFISEVERLSHVILAPRYLKDSTSSRVLHFAIVSKSEGDVCHFVMISCNRSLCHQQKREVADIPSSYLYLSPSRIFQ